MHSESAILCQNSWNMEIQLIFLLIGGPLIDVFYYLIVLHSTNFRLQIYVDIFNQMIVFALTDDISLSKIISINKSLANQRRSY